MPGSRSIRRLATPAVLLALLLSALASPAGAADRIAVSSRGFEAGPVLAADGRIVIAERLAAGHWAIVAIDPRTRQRTALTRFTALPEATSFSVLRLQGSGAIVTATLDRFKSPTDPTAEQATPSLQTSDAFSVLPALPRLATCEPVRADFPAPLLAAGGSDFIATTGCHDESAVFIRSAGGVLEIPGTSGGAAPSQNFDLRAAGPYVAWRESRLTSTGPSSSFVAARAATGEVLLRAPAANRFGLGTDGTVAVADFGGCTLRTVTLAPLAERTAALPAGLCPGLVGDIAVAGGRVAYPVAGSYAVSDRQGAAHIVDGLPAESVSPLPIAFDGRMLYGVHRGCDTDALLAADTTVPGGAPLPLSPPASHRTCPVRRAGAGRVRVAGDRRVSIRVRCTSGCRGTLRLVEQRRGGRERIVGHADFATAPRTINLRPRIASYARALAGCSGGLRVIAKVYRPGDGAKGLGAFRILSRSRCRRTGGPAFGPPQPWP